MESSRILGSPLSMWAPAVPVVDVQRRHPRLFLNHPDHLSCGGRSLIGFAQEW